jgi:hypothetical protein
MTDKKYLYFEAEGKHIVEQLAVLGVKAELIGTLPSNHDIDILVDKATIPSKTPIHWLTTKLGAIKQLKTDIGSLFIVSRFYGHLDIFFEDPRRIKT